MRSSILAEREYSFTELCISEAVNIVRKNQCCRRTFLYGVLIGCSKYKGDDFTVRVKSYALCELLTRLIKEQFGRDVIAVCKSAKTDTYELSFASRGARTLMTDSRSALQYMIKCPSCTGAFLCGLLSSCVSINDPRRDYYLSIRIPPSHKGAVEEALGRAMIDASYREIGSKSVYYMRASSKIEDFLALCGMQRILFDFINQKIENEYRNNTNRAINVEVNNIKKTIASAQKYIEAIEWLRDNDRLTGLDSELSEAARLRVEHPECSLASLGQMMTPAVSKSGVLHRLNRIYAIYEQSCSNK